jgi:transcriptional regulator with PAS, ATPase and Fis domain
MKNLYILCTPHLSDEQKNLLQLFLNANMNNLAFVEALDSIANHLAQFQIINDEIDDLYWSAQHNTRIYCMDVRDILGRNRNSIVIKQLRNFKHTYEIRINQEYYKHRILFQFNHLEENGLMKEEFFILSYGFSKIDGLEDLTDKLSTSNDYIKDDILLNGNEKTQFDKWLGGEWLEL